MWLIPGLLALYTSFALTAAISSSTHRMPEPELVDDGLDGSSDEEAEEAGLADNAALEDSLTSGSSAAMKKKKKKKGKKKKKAAAVNGTTAQEPTATASPSVTKAEADRRYTAALSAIKAEDLWVELCNSNLQDVKLRKLLDHLKKNESVTSLNLSQNQLSDDAAQALAATLGTNASSMPGLITLDLRANNFSDDGLTILEGLKKLRRNLNIMTGPILPPEAPTSPKAVDKGGRDIGESKLVRKYFQIGNADEDDDMPAATSEPSIDPAELWQQLDGAVMQGVATIPVQLYLLKQLCQQLGNELGSLNNEYSAHHGANLPHVKACLEHLHTLESILDITPPPVVVQYSKEPQAAVGSHRVFVAEAVSLLLAANSSRFIQQLLAPTSLVARVVHLSLAHPLSSAIQSRAARILAVGVLSPVEGLLGPMLVAPGWGCSLPVLPAAAAAGGADQGSAAGLCPPLPEVLATLGAASVGVVGGKRSPLTGFVIEASKILAHAHQLGTAGEQADSDSDAEVGNEVVQRPLRVNTRWCDYISAYNDEYCQLAREQEGDLGGPRAVRSMNMLEGQELAELAGGGLITGSELLALLQNMSIPSS